jgi:predicted Zn-dependent peptidase
MTVNRKDAPAIGGLSGMVMPGVERRTLLNGVQMVLLNQGQQPVNRLVVMWNVGLADVDNQAALRLMRVMLREDTALHSGAELAEILEFNGAWLNIEVGRHSTSITVYSLNKAMTEVLPLISEMIQSPLFLEETLLRLREKEASARELLRRKVTQQAAELNAKLLYGDTNPVAQIVTADDIRKVEQADLVNLHRSLFMGVAPSVYFAGALTPDLIAMVEQMFGSIAFAASGTMLSQHIIPISSALTSCRQLQRDENALQTAINIAIPSLDRQHPDREVLRLAVYALGGYFGSRLMSNIREDKGYTYGINAALATALEGGYVTITCQCDNQYVQAVLNEIEVEIKRLATERISDEELNVVRSTIITGYAALLDSPFSICDYYQLLDAQCLPQNYYQTQIEAISNTSAERLQQVVAQHLLNAPRIVALAGNSKN